MPEMPSYSTALRSATELPGLLFTLDASGYRWTQHKNKYGQEYGSGAQRERY